MQFEKKHKTYSIKKLLRLHENGKLNLNPGFQRESVWVPKEQLELIDTILRGMPLPNMFFWHRKEGKKDVYDVIDGKQRIESIMAFTRRRLPIQLKNFDPENLVGWNWVEPYDWTWKEIVNEEPRVAREFLNYEIPVVSIKGTMEDVEKVFVRINSTGKKLTSQEIRHAKWQNNDLLVSAEKIARSYNRFFRELNILSEGQLTRMKAVELVSEIMLSIYQEGVLDKKKALDRVIGNNMIHGATLKRLEREALSILRYMKQRFSNIKETRFKKTSDFYALCFVLWKMKRDGYRIDSGRSVELAFEMLKQLSLELAEYTQAVREGRAKRLTSVARRYHESVVAATDTAGNRRERVRIIEAIIRPVFKSKDRRRLFTPEQKQLLWHGTTDKKCAHPGCTAVLTWNNLQIDHMKAHAKGGRTNLRNAQIMCGKHNREKGAR